MNWIEIILLDIFVLLISIYFIAVIVIFYEKKGIIYALKESFNLINTTLLSKNHH